MRSERVRPGATPSPADPHPARDGGATPVLLATVDVVPAAPPRRPSAGPRDGPVRPGRPRRTRAPPAPGPTRHVR
ncbi:hypothetical protein Ae406Ps2_1979c [Pseudonocardia sp. Ae406_Ps2]|nr:hypothetical protein Ae406Ps2_1979c [Pseudonocardia sp. Ae406_Ps2]